MKINNDGRGLIKKLHKFNFETCQTIIRQVKIKLRRIEEQGPLHWLYINYKYQSLNYVNHSSNKQVRHTFLKPQHFGFNFFSKSFCEVCYQIR